MKNFFIVINLSVLIFILQGCCNKGILYKYLAKDDYFAYAVGDTLLYINEKADTEKYVITTLNRRMVETDIDPGDCYSYEYSEIENVEYRKITSVIDTNWFWIKPPYYFGIEWNGNSYLNNEGHEHIDSIVIDNIIYRKIHKFNLHPQIIIFNYKYGVIQYEDSLKQLWTIKQP